MRKALTLLLIAPVFCLGQKKDSLPISADKGITSSVYGTNVLLGGNLIYDTIIHLPKQDTIPVIMLVCDTSVIISLYRKKVVWYEYGYAIREEWTTKTTGIFYHEPTYLDKDKKPLPKSIVVWLVKEIN